MLRNSSVNGLRKLAVRRKAAGAAGAAWIYQCHAPNFSNSTLAVCVSYRTMAVTFPLGHLSYFVARASPCDLVCDLLCLDKPAQ